MFISSSRRRYSCHSLRKSTFKQRAPGRHIDPVECRGVSLYCRHDWVDQYHVSLITLRNYTLIESMPRRFLTSCSTFIDFRQNKILTKTIVCSRLLFLAGIAVLITGGCLQGSDSPDDQETGTKLVRIGYCIVTVFVACLLSFQLFFWTRKSKLSHTSFKVRIYRSGISETKY